MSPIHTILHPTDFSLQSENAFNFASSLARSHKSRLIVLHVRESPAAVCGEFGSLPVEREPIEPLRDKLIRLHSPDSIAVEHHLKEGDPAREILAAAREFKADLIVLGTHGRTGLSRLLMGSVAEQVVRKAPCPVLSIKTPFDSTNSLSMVAQEKDTHRAGVTPKRAREEGKLEDKLTTVTTVANPSEAEIIRNALQAEGIRCFLEGINQAGAAGVLGLGIKLQVAAGDVGRARKLLRHHEAHAST
jgi:nucleotide-binding universal stress UspA family protein